MVVMAVVLWFGSGRCDACHGTVREGVAELSLIAAGVLLNSAAAALLIDLHRTLRGEVEADVDITAL